MVERTTVPGINGAARRRLQREQVEVFEMIARLRDDIRENRRGWTWNLLHVLDWYGATVEENEGRYRPRRFLPEPAVPYDVKKGRAERRARRGRLVALERALERAMPDLEWVVSRDRRTRAVRLAQIADARDIAAYALEQAQQHDLAHAAIAKIHGKVRRVDHVRGAALRILAELHDAEGPVKLSRLIEHHSDASAPSPRPCPGFAPKGVDVEEKVTKLLQRS
jgi:hypothetical protein